MPIKLTSPPIHQTSHFKSDNTSVKQSQAYSHAEELLQNSINNNNIVDVQNLLKKGISPRSMSLTNANDDMVELVNYAKRLDKLYPQLPTSKETDLDNSLRAVVHGDLPFHEAKERVIAKLKAEIGLEKSPTWAEVVKTNRVDVQRAFLLLYPNRSLHQVLPKAKPGHDRRIRQVIKETPYFKQTDTGCLSSFNCEVKFHKRPKRRIVCADLSAERLLKQGKNVNGKFYTEIRKNPFASESSTYKHFKHITPADLLKSYRNLIKHCRESHLICNNRLGQNLIGQFKSMEKNDEPLRLMLIQNMCHAMSMRLRIKTKNQTKQYVVEFFDPNITNSHRRIASDDLHTIEKLTLQELIYSKEYYDQLYPISSASSPSALGNENAVTMMHVVDSSKDYEKKNTPPPMVPINKRLSSCDVKEEENTSYLIFDHLISEGAAGEIRRLASLNPNISVGTRLKYPLEDSPPVIPAFYKALHFGYTDTVRAVGEMLKTTPVEERTELVEDLLFGHTKKLLYEVQFGEHQKFYSGFFRALLAGHSDTIRAVGEILATIAVEKRTELLKKLLLEKDLDGFSGCNIALRRGDFETVLAVRDILKIIPNDNGQRTQLVKQMLPKRIFRWPIWNSQHANFLQQFRKQHFADLT